MEQQVHKQLASKYGTFSLRNIPDFLQDFLIEFVYELTISKLAARVYAASWQRRCVWNIKVKLYRKNLVSSCNVGITPRAHRPTRQTSSATVLDAALLGSS